MSQELKTKSVAITNISALERAVEKVRAKGHNVTLVEKSTARMWNGRPKEAAYVIKLHDKSFDVAVNLAGEKDGKPQYNLSFDDWNGEIYSVLGKEIEGIEHGFGHARAKSGKKFDQEELTLSNVNELLTDYYTEAFQQDLGGCGYQISTHEENKEKILQVYV